MRYSWEWIPDQNKFVFVAHFDEIWVKQSMDPKAPWRKIRIVIITTKKMKKF